MEDIYLQRFYMCNESGASLANSLVENPDVLLVVCGILILFSFGLYFILKSSGILVNK